MKPFFLKPFFGLAVVALLASCGGGSPTPEPVVRPDSAPFAVSFRALPRIEGPNFPRASVIQNELEWVSVWNGADKGAPLSASNFLTETVLLVASGTKPTNAYAVVFTSVMFDGIKIVANVMQIFCPGPAGQAITHPAAAIAIPKTSKEVVFNITQIDDGICL